MTCSVRPWPALLLLLVGGILGGCLPPGQTQSEEEKDPHYQAGVSHLNTMDYPAAIESFERALAANPKSAAAQRELGWLFDQKVPDPAEAIHYYARYLKLRPDAPKAEWVKQRILACKQELARTVSLGPISEKQQRDLERLAEDKKRLTDENKQLSDEVSKWRAFYTAQMRGPTNQPARPLPPGPTNPPPARLQTHSPQLPGLTTPPGRTASAQEPALSQTSPTNPAPLAASAGGPRNISPPRVGTHTVKVHETLASIARQHGLRVDALSAANPGLNPRRLLPGRVLNLPPP